MATRRISVEISNSAVRMAEIAIGGTRPELINLGQVGLPPRAVVDGAIVEPGAVQAALERCVKEGGFSQGEVHLGISGLRAITRELDMPPVPDSEIDAAVRLQALDVIPFPMDKAVISAQPLEDVLGADGMPERRVLIAAAHRDLVDPLVDVVVATGLVPQSIEPTSSAMIRALYDPTSASEGPEAIISVGAGLTTVVVHERGIPHFVRTIADGGDAITAAIAGALDLPINDAEATKRSLDQTGPHIRVAATAARDAASALIGELRSSIDYYTTLPGRDPVQRVVITGGGSRLLGFVEQLQQQLRVPVIVGSALGHIDCTRLGLPPEEIGRLDPSMAVVVGLALPATRDVKQLDLLPPEFLQQRARKRLERRVIVAAVLLIIVMLGLGGWRYWNVRQAENSVATLKTQVAQLNAEIPKYDKVQAQQKLITSYAQEAIPIVSSEINWPAVLAEVKTYTPPPGSVVSFSGVAATPTVTTVDGVAKPTPVTDSTPIAVLSMGISSPSGYPYFNDWINTIEKSKALRIQSVTGVEGGKGVAATFSSTVAATAVIKSSRLTEFKLP